MDILATLIFITVLILVVAFIVRPLVAPHEDGTKRPVGSSSSGLRQRADLLAERNRVYRALRDLDFDHQTNKIADEEYALQRRTLVAAGVGVLQRLDELTIAGEPPNNDLVEASVLAIRQGEAAPSVAEAALHCPRCGGTTRSGDAFCGHCGASLGFGD